MGSTLYCQSLLNLERSEPHVEHTVFTVTHVVQVFKKVKKKSKSHGPGGMQITPS